MDGGGGCETTRTRSPAAVEASPPAEPGGATQTKVGRSSQAPGAAGTPSRTTVPSMSP